MAYFDKTDCTRVISVKELDDILEQAASESPTKTASDVFDDLVRMGEAKVRMYLGNVYDVTAEFAKAGNNRDEAMLTCAIIIGVYFAHFTLDPEDVPVMRENAYKECIKELEAGRDGKLKFSAAKLAAGNANRVRRITGGSHEKFISKHFLDDYPYTE